MALSSQSPETIEAAEKAAHRYAFPVTQELTMATDDCPRSFMHCIHPEDLGMAAEIWETLERTEQGGIFEIRVKRTWKPSLGALEEDAWVQCVFQPNIEAGKCTGIMGCLTGKSTKRPIPRRVILKEDQMSASFYGRKKYNPVLQKRHRKQKDNKSGSLYVL